MNKKGILLRDVVFAMILLSGIIALFVLAVASVENNYGRTDITSESFSQNYDKLTEVTEDVDVLREDTAANSGTKILSTLEIAFEAFFGVLGLIFGTLDIYSSMASNMAADFPFLDANVMGIVGIVLLSLLTVVILFVWLGTVNRQRI